MYGEDYYFKYVNANIRLSASRYVMGRLIDALKATGDTSIETNVALNLAESELVEIIKVLNGEEA